ncbi:nucleotide exchange factor GrpE [Aetokthonos hydrillicola Thurmond2011]|jgi:molecular chaperone GrpE|uniref:Protein GrpE n=1 Tax=Aetokthonos hydrillicola Thurmond2011 TaxID=2712845 RepID=A0AAP5MAH4_9CYAN|nr:nucleotide exchange factor GrpE [Aetokthonos hydrillicola]MBO3460445.1 nucleotide exchange factor GrpE [Aetokthonos hydrillicola CCALA 1050]MBW4588478.1 nucleotide exchange factor GrpE [Aetokthonos hydrillicola CCALA 1050]MDR9896807.1 nucleotide exchange factor GrpE [Aetokthonos hydrillicola Thurmond2011]
MTNDNEKEALFAKFLDYLHSEQTPPEYLGETPEIGKSFDPYQMVAEWVALRHEVKQQGKTLRSAQDALQQALEETRKQEEQLQTRLEESQKQALAQYEQQQEKLLQDLLGIQDALDRACAYWEEELEVISATSTPKSQEQTSFWGKLKQSLFPQQAEPKLTETSSESTSLREILTSNQQGVELIRRSLLQVLRQRRVVPIEAEKQPFNPQTMYAVGRRESADVVENTVIQEVVRGYLWGDRVLREAQVIVAVGSRGAEEQGKQGEQGEQGENKDF